MLKDNEFINVSRDKTPDYSHPAASPAALISLVVPCYNEEAALPVFYE
jgi:hypothetical protein